MTSLNAEASCKPLLDTFKSDTDVNNTLTVSCEQSGLHFDSSTSFASHMKTHATEKLFPCMFCSLTFSYMANLKEHIRVHTGEKPFSCEYCQKSFKRSGHLTRHLQIHMRDSGKPFAMSAVMAEWVDVSAGKPLFRCKFCEKQFVKISGFTDHVHSHAVNQRCTFGCCQVSCHHVNQINQLLEEIARQSNDNNAAVCESLDSGTVVQHGSKVYSQEIVEQNQTEACSEYGEQFNGSNHRQKLYSDEKHRTMTFSSPDSAQNIDNRPFICGECNIRFMSSASLITHMRMHTGEKTLECLVCGAQFEHEIALQHHQSQVHPRSDESLVEAASVCGDTCIFTEAGRHDTGILFFLCAFILTLSYSLYCVR